VAGPTRIYGFEGDDGLYPQRGDRAYGGPGNDRMVGSGLLLGGKGDDRIDGQAHDVAPSSLGGGDGNDFITGSEGRNNIDGGSGSDRISARGGNDQIKARDGERDVVRCGPGRDIVSADRRDRVGSDCEDVLHRPLPGRTGPLTRRAAGPNPHCSGAKAKGSHIVARTRTTVVYERGFYTYACLYKVGYPRRLIDEGGGIKSGEHGEVGVKIQGRYVAYATYGSAIGDEFDRMYVFDARAGVPVLVEGSNYISSIALKPNGSVAWIQLTDVQDRDQDTTSYEVRKVSLTEKQGNVLLDRGTGIAPKSLKLAPDGTSVTWTRDGAVQTAPLG
jgi:Ca2+-binding RTX toxin-like protein